MLAGGFAKRLGPLGIVIPKPLLEVNGRPVIDYAMDKLSSLKPDQVIVMTNRRFENDFKEWLGSRKYVNVEIWVENSMREEEKPGAILAMSMLLDEVVEDDYLIIAGDNLFSLSLQDFYDFYRKVNSPVVGVYDIRDRELVKMYSCVELDGEGRIISFVEKPASPSSTIMATAIYVFPWRSFVRIKEYMAEGGHRDAPGHFISWLCRREPVYGYVFRGYWFDIGTLRTYVGAQESIRIT